MGCGRSSPSRHKELIPFKAKNGIHGSPSKTANGHGATSSGALPPTPTTGRGRFSSILDGRSTEKKQAENENEEYRETMDFLAAVPLFQRLPKDQRPILASACVTQTFQPGKCVIKQGEMGSEFFVIRSGQARVTIEDGDGSAPHEVAQLKGGDYFGEAALLRSQPRTATITALTTLSTLRIDRQKFQDLSLHERLHFGHRNAVGGNIKVITQPPSKKTAAERKAISEAIRGNSRMASMINLDEKRIARLVDVAWTEDVPAGKEIIKLGDPIANYFYVVKSGSFEIIVGEEQDESHPRSAEEVIQGVRRVKRFVKAGGCFGELAMIYSAPRSATVVATEPSVVWVIDRDNFKNILMSQAQEKDHLEKHTENLKAVPVLRGLSDRERRALAMAMTEMHFVKGDKVVRQGEPGNNFYVLFDGEVSVLVDGVEQRKLVACRERGKAHYFGERALINNEPRTATVMVTSTNAKAMALDQAAFTLLLGPLENRFKLRTSVMQTVCTSCLEGPCKALLPALRRGKSVTRKSESMLRHMEATKKMMRKAEQQFQHDGEHVRRKDLRRIGVLGCGAFGTVELVEHVQTEKTYAMKCLNKGHIVRNGMKQSVMSERTILMMTKSPFIIELYETFNGTQTLYFLLEPALGGELHAIYHRKQLHGSEAHARYYCGGVVFAFEHLHERRIIYRDLKPENLLLNEDGQLKLTDMGFAKFVIGKTYTTCGTPDYFAPEVIMSSGHCHAVDWWCLGILLFELMVGRPPFEADTSVETYAKVMRGLPREHYPAVLRGAAGDLVQELLRAEPPDRLAMRPGGTENVKAHAWYNAAGFHWPALASLDMDPPLVPIVKHNKDIANFSFRPEDLPPEIPYKDDGTGWDKDFASSA